MVTMSLPKEFNAKEKGMSQAVKINKKKVFASLFVVGLVWLLCEPAMAASSGGGGLPYESWLTLIVDSVSGPVAYAVSVVAMVGAGAGLIFGGEMNGFLKTLLVIVLVLSFVIAAKNTISTITGKGAQITAPQSTIQPARTAHGA